MVVDTQRLQTMLLDVLPHALAGESVARLAERLPWPSGAARNGTTGLWWDVTT